MKWDSPVVGNKVLFGSRIANETASEVRMPQNFIIANTFTDSLAKLTTSEQKAVKATSFDLQVDPSHPGFQLHRLDRARDKNFWSVRAGSDIRIIIHRTDTDFVLCYVDHHDNAYDWAEKRRLENHPTTGAAQLVEVHETVKEIIVPTYVNESPPRSLPPGSACALFGPATPPEC